MSISLGLNTCTTPPMDDRFCPARRQRERRYAPTTRRSPAAIPALGGDSAGCPAAGVRTEAKATAPRSRRVAWRVRRVRRGGLPALYRARAGPVNGPGAASPVPGVVTPPVRSLARCSRRRGVVFVETVSAPAGRCGRCGGLPVWWLVPRPALEGPTSPIPSSVLADRAQPPDAAAGRTHQRFAV